MFENSNYLFVQDHFLKKYQLQNKEKNILNDYRNHFHNVLNPILHNYNAASGIICGAITCILRRN
jgi:hypothetical protein